MELCAPHVQVLTMSSIVEFLKFYHAGCVVYINTYFCTYLDHTQQSQNLMPRDQPEEERINAKYVENGRQK